MLNTRQLASWLREAKEAHAVHEKLFIEPDGDWSWWYAEWLLPRLQAELDSRNLNAAKGGMKL